MFVPCVSNAGAATTSVTPGITGLTRFLDHPVDSTRQLVALLFEPTGFGEVSPKRAATTSREGGQR